MERVPDRRELILGGARIATAALAAGSIPLLASARHAFAANSGDAEVLASAVDLERISVLAYEQMIAGGLLSPRVERVMRRFRDHEQEHADAVLTALTDLGGSVPPQPTPADVERVASGIGDMSSEKDVVEVAIALELAAIAAYHDAQKRLVDGRLLQTGVSIMAAEAQHLVVLREAAGQVPVTTAFEDGSDG